MQCTATARFIGIALFVLTAAPCAVAAQAARSDPQQIIAGWPPVPQKVARKLIEKYGPPDEITPSHLIWKDNGPWKKTIVSREEIPHNFPMKHTDMLEQFIEYRVPPEKFDDLALYDGSVIAERTKGVLSARCDMEEMNLLALNLANDVVTGKRSVAEARQFYARTAMEFKQGKRDPYTQKLQFRTDGVTADPDKEHGMKNR